MLSYDKLYLKYKKLYSLYLDKLIFILNNYHKKQYNKDYWEPIIGLYVRKFLIDYLLTNKTNQERLFKKATFKKINFYKNYSEFVESNDKSFYKFKKIYNNEYYKLEKKSFILEKFNTLILTLPNILVKLGILKVFFQESYFKKSLKYFFSLRSVLYLFPLPILKFKNYDYDKKKIYQNRLNIIKINEIKNSKDFILQNMIVSMPISYIENFEIILNEVKKIAVTKALYVDGNEVKFDYLKFYIAELIKKKKKILTGQHSLRTGLEDFDIYFDYSNSISNNYLTWGWNDKKNFIKKFSSIRIFSSLKKYKRLKKIINEKLNICFILCSYSKIGECIPDNYIENFKAEKERINLLNFVRKKKVGEISLKPRSGSFLIFNKDRFYKSFNILKNKSRMYEVFGNYNVVIFERLSLGIAECIYLNQPAIFYYPKNLYRQKNKKYIEMISLLKKANIFFDNKKKMIRILQSQKNINSWWFDKKNIKNRNFFLMKYADPFNYKDLSKFKKLV